MLTEAAPLAPRYQRPLTFGAILDETFQLYRRRWLTYVGILLITVIPYVLVIAMLGGVGFAAVTNPVALRQITAGNPTALAGAIGGLVTAGLIVTAIFAVCQLAAAAAAILVADGGMRGRELRVMPALRSGLQRLWALRGAAILYVLFLLGITIVAAALLVPQLGGLLGGPVAVVCLVIWAANPGARRPWLKWLIILAVPFGLSLYYGTRWSLYSLAVVLEGAGPRTSLRRSADLVRGRWFRVWGCIAMVSIIAAILQSIPSIVVSAIAAAVILGSRSAAATGGSGIAINVVTNAAGLVGWVLFGGLIYIALTVIFEDLRNRAEGADLTERMELRPTGSAGSQ